MHGGGSYLLEELQQHANTNRIQPQQHVAGSSYMKHPHKNRAVDISIVYTSPSQVPQAGLLPHPLNIPGAATEMH